MDYISAFIIIFCFAVGTTTYILSIVVLKKYKNDLVGFFITLLSFLTCMILIATIMIYTEPILIKTSTTYYVLAILSRFFTIGFAIAAILLAHRLLKLFQSRRAYCIEIAAMIIATSATMIIYIHALLTENIYTKAIRAFDFSDIIVYPALVYPFLLSFICRKRIEDSILRKVVKTIVVVNLIGCPFILLEDFNILIRFDIGTFSQVSLRFLVFPLLYLVFNILLLYYGFTYLLAQNRRQHAKMEISDKLIEKYGITSREKEIIVLLLNGLSNKMISEKLFISPATVRNHIHNIFDKTGVSSRIELVKLCHNLLY